MISSRRRLLTVLALTSLTAGSLAVTGCSRQGSYRNKPTPGVFSTAMTNEEAGNNWYYMMNSNIRALIDDWGRFTLISRPSRMMPHPTSF